MIATSPARLRQWAGAMALAGIMTAGLVSPGQGQAKKEEGFQTAAPYAILIDADSGSVLFEKSADTLTPPSSLAKLMTAELVFKQLKDGELKPDQEFTISEGAWRRGGAPSHSSSMFAPIHSRVRIIDLLHGAIVQSGNDACIALAEGMAGNEKAFAALMTQRARELGLPKSVFTNATGLPDPDQKVTVRELAKLAAHIIRSYPEYFKIYSEREFTWNKIRQQNRNPLLTLNIGADGMKTGFTKDGGYGLVGTAMQNGLRLIVAINGLKDAKARGDEGRRLLEWGFRGFEAKPLFAEDQTIAEAKMFGGASGRVPLVADGAVKLLVPRNSNDKIMARVVYTGPVAAPVEKGKRIGLLKVWRGENVVLEVPLQAATDVPRGSLPQRAFDAASELVINLFRAGVQRL